nr:trypsin-like peptidase domain-containing protein [uncultured Oscillibacter sp.]
MYNDERNLYHYTYRRDGSETTQPPADDYQPIRGPVQEMKPVKKNRIGLKVTALALSCALLGGGVGGGVVWAATSRGGGAPQTVQGAPAPGNAASGDSGSTTPSTVTLNRTDTLTPLTDKEVYDANVDSVVSINTTGTATTSNGFWQTRQPTAGAGSGFVLTPDGFIATNYHVIDGAETVKVTFYSGDSYDAEVIGGDEDYDIAVIKVEAENLKPVTMGDSTQLSVGDRVLAIGNPLGELTFSMTGGMVSSVNRAINVEGVPFNMIQTDASINPGNSGGPMFNQYGQVVGIVSAKYTNTASGTSAEGLGFAIPINDVAAMIQDIMTNGYVTNKPYLGVTAMSMSQDLANQFRYDITEGVFISAVDKDGAADQAGLQMGDVITKVDDHEIKTMADLTIVKKQYSAGDTVTLTVYRQGETITAELTWDAVPEDQQVQEPQQPQGGNGGNEQYGGGYTNPYDLFDYFFGNRGW